MAHYDTFHYQLAMMYPARSHALWDPNSGELEPHLEAGDVNSIREGKFHRLVSVMCSPKTIGRTEGRVYQSIMNSFPTS